MPFVYVICSDAGRFWFAALTSSQVNSKEKVHSAPVLHAPDCSDISTGVPRKRRAVLEGEPAGGVVGAVVLV